MKKFQNDVLDYKKNLKFTRTHYTLKKFKEVITQSKYSNFVPWLWQVQRKLCYKKFRKYVPLQKVQRIKKSKRTCDQTVKRICDTIKKFQTSYSIKWSKQMLNYQNVLSTFWERKQASKSSFSFFVIEHICLYQKSTIFRKVEHNAPLLHFIMKKDVLNDCQTLLLLTSSVS